MANISSITLPNGNNYGFTGTVYNVIGTQTAATGSWTGALHGVSALYTGLTIMYYLPWAGSGNATLNLTLDDGTTTGAVNCYYSNSRLTTHYGKGCNIIMTYYKAGDIKIDGTATTDNRWIANANYADGNSVAYRVTTYYNRFKAGANKIFPYTIIMQCPDGRWESIVTSSSTGTSKARNTHAFILGQIAVMYANATYNENATVGDNVVWDHATDLIDHRYSFNTANNSTSGTTAVKPIYLVGSINPLDGYFYLDTTWWTQTLPTTNDGKLYIYLGDAYDYYRMSFRMNHPIYCHTNGMIREYAQDCATINGLTVEKSVPSNAKFTDTTYTLQTSDNYIGIKPSSGVAQYVELNDVVNACLGTGSDTTTYLRNDGTWATPTNTTYSAGTGLSLSSTTFNHSNSVTAGTAGTSSATSGSTLAVPYVTYDAQGHVTASGTHTHTVTGFSTTDTKNTAGSTDTSSKIFLIGATSQAANPQTYSQDTAYVGTDGCLYSGGSKVITDISEKVSKAGDTMTGTLKVGNPANNSTFPTVGYAVHDVRGVAHTPGGIDVGVNFFFSNNTMPTADWYSGIYVKGWSSGYNAWEIVGPSTNADSRLKPLYVRTSKGNTEWGSWRKIFDASNPPTAAEVGVFKKVWTNSDPHTAHDYSTDATITIDATDMANFTKVRIDFFPVYAVYNMTSQYFDLPSGTTYPVSGGGTAFGTYLTMCYRNIDISRTSATQLKITWAESGKFATYGSSARTAGTAFMIPANIYLTN